MLSAVRRCLSEQLDVIIDVVGVIRALLGTEVAKEDIQLMTAEEIYDKLYEIAGDSFNHVTISGGNPALIKGIQSLVDLFDSKNIQSALRNTRK
ncbi:radical activating enzyme [Staphylococcus gallinarum]|uniref:Radical activating enzyme n=1 Tax=Staphylococcus gallinarum TaxID=1293 RepID=A0A380FCI6_STAGA|nr:radical activating enzyme [Staphylococcus gallinarum]